MSIEAFQTMMKEIYFVRDGSRGVDGTYRWLTEEVAELGDAIHDGDKQVLADEFADVLAWLVSLANLVDINLEAAALGKYPGCCPRCQTSPCTCPPR
jgi:NTP pyrophosphatase (non-canonical NTP hydrolase)